MPSKAQMKYINALRLKKNRSAEGVFVAEGEKLVRHLLGVLGTAKHLYSTKEDLFAAAELISEAEMKQLTHLAHPSPVLGVFAQPTFRELPFSASFTLVLDALRDPGNLGTIIRLCDWFGVPQIICTEDCVDALNEKTVQASMGSVASVQVLYYSREEILTLAQQKGVALIATAMQAPPAHGFVLPLKSALVIGNEGQGISEMLAGACSGAVSIPAAPGAKAESLNAAMSAAILLAEFTRQSAG